MNMPVENPYVGPRTFLESDGDRFFGRDREARDLLALVVSEPLVLFYAQSGAGKSSLVNTRLIPDLRKRGFQTFTGRVSGDAPAGVDVENIFVFNLLQSLTPKGTEPAALASVSLKDFIASSFKDNLSQATQPHALIIDQFEELFRTHHEAWEKRADFFSQLAEAMEANPYLWVVLIMREDFIASLDPYIHMLPGRLRMRYYMQRLERAAALDAIKKPVRNLRPFEEDVAEKLVDDLRGVKIYRPDGTPEIQPGQYVEPVQLQVVCANLWDNLKLKPPSDTITGQDLLEVGDVDTSLGNYYADRVKAVADSQKVHERKIREWFGRELISSGGVRTPVLREPNGTSGGLEDRVVQALHDLVRAEQRGGVIFYELTHDRLVEPILANNKNWEEIHFSPLQRQASLWNTQGQDEKWLLSDQALIEVELWARENPNDVTDIDEAFLHASRKYQEKLDADRETQRRELEMSQKLADEQAKSVQRARQSNVVYIIMGVIAVIAAIYAFFGQRQAKEAEERANDLAKTAQDLATEARSNELATLALDRVDNQLDLAILLGLEANSILDSTQSRRALLTILQEAGRYEKSITFEQSIESFHFSSDGRSFTLLNDESISFWDLDGNRLGNPIHIDAGSLYSVEFNPKGGSFATLNEEGVIIWGLDATKLGGPFLGPPASIFSTAISPDGSILAAGGKDGSILLWDFESRERLGEPLSEHTEWTNNVSFSPNGQILVSASDDQTFILWDLSDPRHPSKIFQSDTLSSCVANAVFSPDGDTLVTGHCGSGVVNVWDVSDPEKVESLKILEYHQDGVYALEFSPDGTILATGSLDGTVALWDLSDPSNGALRGKTGEPFISSYSVYSVDISPDGSLLASGHSDGTISFWDISNLEVPSQIDELLFEHNATVNSVRFSPDGQTMASASFDGTIILWDVATRQTVSQLTSLSFIPVNSVAFHPNGRVLAAATENGFIRLWDVSTRESSVEIEKNKLTGKGTLPDRIEYSHDGNFLTLFSTNPTEFSQEETGVVIDALNLAPIGKGQIVFEDPEEKIAIMQVREADVGDQLLLIDMLNNRFLGQSILGTYLAFTPAAEILAYKTIGEDGQSTINLLDLSADRRIKGTVEGEFISMSPDGSIVVYQSFNELGESEIFVRDIQKDSEINSIPLNDLYSGPFMSENGEILAFTTIDGMDGTTVINIFSALSGERVAPQIKTSENRDILILSTNGRVLIYSGYDSKGNQIVGALDTITGDDVGNSTSGYLNQSLEIEQLLVYETYDYETEKNQVHLINLSNSQEIEHLNGTFIDIINGGETLVYNDNGVSFYDIKKRKQLGEPIKSTYLEITQDGRTLATLSGTNTITFWNLEKTWPIGEPFNSETDQLTSAVLSPDGKTLAWVGPDGLSLQDAESGNVLNESIADHFSNQVRGEDTIFSPDGRTMAVTDSTTSTTTVWDLKTKQQIGGEFHGIYVILSPDGQSMAIQDINRYTTTVLDLERHQPIAENIPGISISFSPNGHMIAVGNNTTESTEVLDLETGQTRSIISGEQPIFLAQGSIIASYNGSTNSTTLWDTAANSQIGDQYPGTYMSGSLDGQYAALLDTTTATVTLLDLSQPHNANRIPGDNPQFSPDGSVLSVVNFINNTINLWDPETLQQVGRPIPGSLALFNSNGRTLAAVDYTGSVVTVWDLSTYEQVGSEISGDTFVLSPDGRILAVGDYDSYTVTFWDVNTQKPVAEELPGESIFFSADGSAAVIVDYNNSFATILDLRDGSSAVSTLPGNSFALSPDGRILAVEDYNTSTVTLWNLIEQEKVGTLDGSRPLFSPDGQYISVSSFFSASVVSVWEVNPFQPVIQQAIHPTILVFSPDSTRLASYAEAGIVVRDLNDNAVRRLEMIKGPIPLINLMGFSQDGSLLMALDDFGVRYIWDAASGKLLSGAESDQPFMENLSGLAQFSPDGKFLIYQSRDGLNIWDIQENKPHPGKLPLLRTISFSPDGRMLAGEVEDGNIILYEFPQLNILDLPLNTGLKEITNLGLVMEDTNLKYLVTQELSGTTQIWDWSKRTEIGVPMSGNLQYVGSSTPNRAVFYIDTSGRLIKFNWDLTHANWVELLCPLARRNFSQEEWTYYFPSASWPPARDKLTCQGYPLGS